MNRQQALLLFLFILVACAGRGFLFPAADAAPISAEDGPAPAAVHEAQHALANDDHSLLLHHDDEASDVPQQMQPQHHDMQAIEHIPANDEHQQMQHHDMQAIEHVPANDEHQQQQHDAETHAAPQQMQMQHHNMQAIEHAPTEDEHQQMQHHDMQAIEHQQHPEAEAHAAPQQMQMQHHDMQAIEHAPAEDEHQHQHQQHDAEAHAPSQPRQRIALDLNPPTFSMGSNHFAKAASDTVASMLPHQLQGVVDPARVATELDANRTESEIRHGAMMKEAIPYALANAAGFAVSSAVLAAITGSILAAGPAGGLAAASAASAVGAGAATATAATAATAAGSSVGVGSVLGLGVSGALGSVATDKIYRWANRRARLRMARYGKSDAEALVKAGKADSKEKSAEELQLEQEIAADKAKSFKQKVKEVAPIAAGGMVGGMVGAITGGMVGEMAGDAARHFFTETKVHSAVGSTARTAVHAGSAAMAHKLTQQGLDIVM